MVQAVVRSVKQQFRSWFVQAQVADTDDDLVDLPDAVRKRIADKARSLSAPKPYRTFVQDSISAAMESWQRNPNASNALVFLSNPVEVIADVIQAGLKQWQYAPAEVIMPFEQIARPEDPLSVTQQIQQALEPYPQLKATDPKKLDQQRDVVSLSDRVTLVVIPCLEQCFLRCIDGWQGIEYLRDVITGNPNCFWVIGCNQMAWKFLESACQINAYFNDVKQLPRLDGDALRDWLDPIANTVVQDNRKATEGDFQQVYWDSLATESSGVSEIAIALWQESLRVKKEDVDKQSPQELQQGNDGCLTLYETNPSSPKLPAFDPSDRYLIHTLLIHGYITRPHLAHSLCETESQTQSRIRRLLDSGIIELREGTFTVKAAHYQKLKTDLTNNNFFFYED